MRCSYLFPHCIPRPTMGSQKMYRTDKTRFLLFKLRVKNFLLLLCALLCLWFLYSCMQSFGSEQFWNFIDGLRGVH
jgi:hypothetical protein